MRVVKYSKRLEKFENLMDYYFEASLYDWDSRSREPFVCLEETIGRIENT
jgi:hypothetical protein